MGSAVGSTQLIGDPTPPAGYQMSPKPPAGYSIQQTVNSVEPYWVSDAVGRPTAVASAPSSDFQATQNTREIAFVDPNHNPTSQVNVVDKELFTPAKAAHETTHNFQNSRNGAFQQNLDALDEKNYGPDPLDKYNYGGVTGLEKNHPEIGQLNREQQAHIVEDLTKAQGQLHAHMTPAELAKWDETKQALERPIQQLQRIPARQNNAAAPVDGWLAHHTIFNGHPLQRALDFISPPKPDTRPIGTPEPPSTALGYAQPSDLVR